MSLRSRLHGAVWGHLVGDAMGVPYEFLGPAEVGDVGWGRVGTHHQPPGTWSDDGGLMLALLDSLLSVGFDIADQARRAVAWMDGPDYKPGRRFDIGNTTRRSLMNVKDGVPAEEAGGAAPTDNGNGSLMRILPIALVGRDLPANELVSWACRASKLTHAHPRSQAACAVYCLAVRALLVEEVDRHEVLERAFVDCAESLPVACAEQLSTIKGHVDRAGSGYVIDTLWSAWSAFASSDTYAETIERAIRYGNDTDTTACVAGGLAGAYWGVESIPSHWLGGMRGQYIVQPLIDRLLGAV